MVAAWLAVFVSANGVAALLGETSVQVGIAVLTVLIGVLLAILQRREAKAEQTDELRELLRLPIREIHERGSHEVGVAPESPHALSEVGRANGDEYVARDADEQLDSALAAAVASPGSTLVIVSGPSKAGKTRTLFEAMQRCLPHGRLVVPRTAGSIDELVKPGVLRPEADRPLVLWLDDVETFLRAGPHGMHPGVLDEFDEWNTPVVVLATAGGKGVLEAGEGASEFAIPMAELLRHAVEIRLSPELSPREREHVDRYASSMATKIARDGIGAFMIAAPDLERKLTTGCHDHGAEPSPHGQAVVLAAIDWQRSGITDPIPTAVLEKVYPNYLPRFVDPSPAGFAGGLEWARAPLYSTVALLLGRDEFQPYDHIVSFAEESGGEINLSAWAEFLAAATDEQAFALAGVAYKRGGSGADPVWIECSERAIRQAMASENSSLAVVAAFNLGVLLTEKGETEEAEAAYRVADAGGYAPASVNLGSMLGKRGAVAEAQAALERGEANGDVAGAYNLGNLFRRQGMLDEAEAAFRRAEGGTASASYNLGNLLRDRGRLDEAEAAFRRAEVAGHPRAPVNLGNLLHQRGELDAAEEVLRRAAGPGASKAYFNLGNIHLQRGRTEEAEAAFRQGDELGDADSAYGLGNVLRERSALNEAEAAYRRAESRGNSNASVRLGILLFDRDDLTGAEAAFRRSADAGNLSGLYNLGVLLKQTGRVEEGEDAIRRSGQSPDQDEAEASEPAQQEAGVGDQGGGDHQQDGGD